MKVCIGIICVGKRYLEEFEQTFKPSVEAYANKYGYDLRIFTEFLDSENTYPDCISFQKCLVPSMLKEYDCVVVLDADIYIHESSPPIHTLLTGKIGIVNEVAQVNPDQYKLLGFASQPTEYYTFSGFEIQTNKILNTGVMLCNPSIHADLLKTIFHRYIAKAKNHPRRFHYEQSCIGYELQTQNMYSLLPNEWNHIYIFDRVLRIHSISYFTHFAGIGNRQAELKQYLSTQRPQSRIRWGIQKKR